MGVLAERIRIPNRAQALSFSLAHVALIRTAAQLATGVARGVGEAVGFDEILHRTTAETPVDGVDGPPQGLSDGNGLSIADLTRKLTETIRSELSKHAIGLNQPLALRVRQDRKLNVEGDHPRAAAIEAILNSLPEVLELAGKVVGNAGVIEIPSDLTSKGEPENMFGPGGYPNW